MSFLAAAASALEEADFGDGGVAVVLFDTQGQEVGRAGSESLPALRWSRGQLEGVPAGWRGEHQVLEAYGACQGVIAWLEDGSRAGAGDPSFRPVIGRLLEQLGSLDYEIDNLSRELAETYESIHLLCDVSSASARTTSVEELSSVLLEHLARQVKCRAGLILLTPAGGEGDALKVAACCGAVQGLAERDGVERRGLLADLLESGSAFLLDDVADRTDRQADPLLALPERSMLAAPLQARDGSIGVLVLLDRCSDDGLQAFDSRDRKMVDAVATQGGAMILGMRMVEVSKELEIGRRIQQSLLPETLPRTDEVEVAGLCAMARVVGGDFYDAALGSDGVLRAVIADVSGHDLGAALLMATARAFLRAELRTERGPADIVARLNVFMHEDLRRAGLFLTYFVIAYDPRSGHLRYSAGGHNPPLLLRAADGRAEMLESPGLPAGLTPDARFPEHERQLRDGDMLLLYTDGLTEAASPDGGLFGEQRLSEALCRHRARDAEQILERVEEEIHAHAEATELQDDGTALLLKVAAVPAPRVVSPQEPETSSKET